LRGRASLVGLAGAAIVHSQMGWENCPMTVQSKATLRFLFWLGLLLFEGSLVIAFYVIPQFQVHEYNAHPDIGSELDAVLIEHPGLKIGLIVYWALFLLGNVGLIAMVWRSFKVLRNASRKE
jgi:hypothetical protein